MTVSPKAKKILAVTGGATLLAVCIFAMTKCSGNAGELDECRDDLAVQTVRADSLEKELILMTKSRDAWRGCAVQCSDSLGRVTDSMVDLNDSIEHLAAANDSLQRQLNKCRGTRRSTKKPAGRAAGNCASCKSGKASASASAKGTVVSVPAAATTNVNVSGGCGNTVNVNNGTINNYYNSATPSTSTSSGTMVIKSSASVRIVKRSRAR